MNDRKSNPEVLTEEHPYPSPGSPEPNAEPSGTPPPGGMFAEYIIIEGA